MAMGRITTRAKAYSGTSCEFENKGLKPVSHLLDRLKGSNQAISSHGSTQLTSNLYSPTTAVACCTAMDLGAISHSTRV
jgi:hypothetical protein